jgi:superoxide dismutase, Cu-Zn family
MSMNCISAICELKKENSVGIVKFHQCPGRKTIITMNFSGMPKDKTMAIHIHEYGDTRKGCDSLGAHFNPDNVTHGSMAYPKFPRHAGDLINNIHTDKNGQFSYTYEDTLVNLKDVLGRSIVIHEGVDDLGQGGNKESKTTGNAGKRFMCGIIGLSNNEEWRK